MKNELISITAVHKSWSYIAREITVVRCTAPNCRRLRASLPMRVCVYVSAILQYSCTLQVLLEVGGRGGHVPLYPIAGDASAWSTDIYWFFWLTHQITPIHLTALCPGLPGWTGIWKVKPIWILLKQETVSGSGISWAICKSAPRSRQITTPAPTTLFFYRPDVLPAVQPTASKHWRQSDYQFKIISFSITQGTLPCQPTVAGFNRRRPVAQPGWANVRLCTASSWHVSAITQPTYFSEIHRDAEKKTEPMLFYVQRLF